MVTKKCSRSPYSSLCGSSERCVTYFACCSAVVRVPRSLSLSSEGIHLWYALMPNVRQYDWKCRICVKLQSGKMDIVQSENNLQIVAKKKLPGAATILCSNKPSHALRVLQAWRCPHYNATLLFYRVSIPSVTSVSMGLLQHLHLAPNLLYHYFVSSSREVANARRISLPTKPISMLTRVQNEDALNEMLYFPRFAQLEPPSHVAGSCVPVPNRADWRHFGAHKGSREATMTKTEPTRAPEAP